VSGGTLQLGNTSALGATSGTVAVNGGLLNLAGFSPTTGAVTLLSGSIANSGAAAALNGASYNVQSGLISASLGGGAAALTKTTSGLVTLSGADSYTGGTTVSGGTLQLGVANALLSTGTVNVNGTSAVLNLGGFSPTVGAFTLTNGTLQNGTLTGSSYALQNGLVSASLAGSGSLTKSTAGIVILTASNSYSGGTSINNNGVLYAGAAGALSTSSAFTINGGTLDASGYAQTIASLTVGNLGTLNLAATNSALQVSGSVQLGGSLNVIGDTGAEILMYFNSNPGSTQFSASTGIAPGFTLSYTSTDLAIVSAGPPSWINTSGGSWTTPGNWNSGIVPGTAAGQGAFVTASAGTAVTITLDTPQTLGVLTLGDSTNSSTAYTLAQGVSGSLTMANTGTSPASIIVTGGGQMIAANVVLAGSLTIAPTAGSTLTISGNMSESSSGSGSLLLNDAGTLILGGTNTFTGGTVVANGTLVLLNNDALFAGTSLTIGDASAFSGGPSGAGSDAAGSAAVVLGSGPNEAAALPSITPVPEPSTFVLLAAGAVLLAVYRKRRRR
jgi:autotransporter-associated beta strand protein